MDSNIIKFSRLYVTIATNMNKTIDTSDRLFMSIVGPSGSGKTRLIFDMLANNVFQPNFQKVFYFYQHDQPIYNQLRSNANSIEFVQGIDFDMINNLPLLANGGSYLLVFDDSCEELFKSKDFLMIATAGRHKKLGVVFIKHNLFHKSSFGRDIELQLTHIVLFKNPRDVNQVNHLARQLGLAGELDKWYKDSTEVPFGFLMIDLSPRTNDLLRYSSGFNPTQFHLPRSKARLTFIEDVHTVRTYSKSVDGFIDSLKETSS